MVNGVPRTQGAAWPEGFWPRDLPRDSIHHDSPKAFPYNVILLASWASVWHFFQPMEPLGSIMIILFQIGSFVAFIT